VHHPVGGNGISCRRRHWSPSWWRVHAAPAAKEDMVAVPNTLSTLCLINRWWQQRDCDRQHERSHRPNTVAAIAGAFWPRALAATSDDRAADGGRS
jgi:hypothetical protein